MITSVYQKHLVLPLIKAARPPMPPIECFDPNPYTESDVAQYCTARNVRVAGIGGRKSSTGILACVGQAKTKMSVLPNVVFQE